MSAAPAVFLGDKGGDERPSRAVFLSDFVHIARPFDDLARVLLDEEVSWLRRLEQADGGGIEGLDERADLDGDLPGPAESVEAPAGSVEAIVRIGPSRGPSQPVRVIAGPARSHEASIIVPVIWQPDRHERLLPRLDADLELSDFDGPYSRLGMSGRYRVPLAHVGLGLDRVALHRVAESSLRRFLREAEGAITASAADS